MKQYLSFDHMITPAIIQILFWIGIAISVIAGLGSIIAGLSATYGGGNMVLTGLITLIIGPIVTRVYCELIIILFSINDNLKDIRKQLSKESPPEI
ncbi:MAG: DUF4282 domain-containing protein [Opitutales bacterium]|nr:DUF4282 domain-containing protein [Opitutales bacterium]